MPERCAPSRHNNTDDNRKGVRMHRIMLAILEVIIDYGSTFVTYRKLWKQNQVERVQFPGWGAPEKINRDGEFAVARDSSKTSAFVPQKHQIRMHSHKLNRPINFWKATVLKDKLKKFNTGTLKVRLGTEAKRSVLLIAEPQHDSFPSGLSDKSEF